KAIRFSALDYLLKPIDVDDLIQALRKVKERLHHKGPAYQYQSVLNNVQHKSGKIDRLAVPSAEGIDFLNIDEIVYCEADGSYTIIYFVNALKKLICRNLKDFENILAESGFFRVHHSFLINIRHIQKYIKGEGGYVIMTGNYHIDISRRRKEEFLKLLDRI
ncbi:MAG: DNA-binding response regulator, partial [Bacteroidia bacterium]|nr:DNA-binding response regulator [Bacteroidia bacterium]